MFGIYFRLFLCLFHSHVTHNKDSKQECGLVLLFKFFNNIDSFCFKNTHKVHLNKFNRLHTMYLWSIHLNVFLTYFFPKANSTFDYLYRFSMFAEDWLTVSPNVSNFLATSPEIETLRVRICKIAQR